MVPGLEQHTGILKKINEKSPYFTWEIPPNNTDPSINEVSIAQGFFTAEKYQAEVLINSATARDKFLRDFRFYLPEVDRAKIEEISNKLDDIKDEYLDKISTLQGTGTIDKIRVEIKLFFDYTNTYRNAVKRELYEAESIMRRGLKNHPLYKNKEVRKMINVDYPKALKSLSDQDNYLKKRIGEILNESPKK